MRELTSFGMLRTITGSYIIDVILIPVFHLDVFLSGLSTSGTIPLMTYGSFGQ